MIQEAYVRRFAEPIEEDRHIDAAPQEFLPKPRSRADIHLQTNMRILLQERTDAVHIMRCGNRLNNTDEKGSFRLCRPAELCKGLLFQGNHTICMPQEGTPSTRKSHTASHTNKQLCTKFFLQQANLLCYR